MNSTGFVPYCGSPPVPGHVAWNGDPILILILLAIGATYALGCRGSGDPTRRERALFAAGFLVAAGALLSPVCNLSVALFSARVSQHMVLILLAAPLVVLGRPEQALAALLPLGRWSTAGGAYAMTIGGSAFAVALWVWHLPGPYDLTLQNNSIYWTMHVSLFGAALLLWHGLLIQNAASAGAALIVGFGTAIQMSLLGAILSLAPKPLFVVHQNTTWLWDLTPLQDQQLGGIIMWVPAGVLFTAYGLVAFAQWLNVVDTPAQPVQWQLGSDASDIAASSAIRQRSGCS